MGDGAARHATAAAIALRRGVINLKKNFIFTGGNHARIYGQENLYKALEDRPENTPLITVANHHSCMDEPLIWGCLKVKHLTNSLLMRWAVAAHNICFTRRFHSWFFAYGKSVPVVRGDGVYQPGVDFMIDRLNEGHWVHLYPEGQVNLKKDNMRIKWGVGRLIAECRVPPIVIPIYHLGMDKVLPNQKPYIPRVGQKVTLVIGKPIDLNDTLEDLKSRQASDEEKRLVLTNVVQNALHELRITTGIYHGKHLAGAPQ